MLETIGIGDYVKLIDLPDWLLKDIPDDEVAEIIECIGKVAQITEIDKFGYYWIGFGVEKIQGEYSHYSGHSFCVERHNIKLISKENMP